MNDPIKMLREAGIENAAHEVNILKRNFQGEALLAAISRRAKREPMSHILGWRDFWKDRYVVSADVLDPRPDSELFLELIGEGFEELQILDLGTGSGALGLSALRQFPNARATLVDVSERALEIANMNAKNLGLLAQIECLQSDWFTNVKGKFNIILCNPPYISESEMLERDPELSFEPPIALTPGGNGLAPYKTIAENLSEFLEEGGRAYFEHGHLQQPDIVAIFEAQGYATACHCDINQKPRIVEVWR